MHNETKTTRNNYNPVQDEIKEDTTHHASSSIEDTITGVELSSERNNTKMPKAVEDLPR